MRKAPKRVGMGDFSARMRLGITRLGTAIRLNAPERLLIAPQEMRIADPDAAADIYSGHYIFAGRTVLTRGTSPFATPSPSYAWTAELHGFSWLRHFRDAENQIVRKHARALVAEWLELSDTQRPATADLPGVMARRLLSWLANAPHLLDQADLAFYRNFMRGMTRDALRLASFAAMRGSGPARLTSAIAFASFSLCALNGDKDWKHASRILSASLNDMILPDGCHISRNPRDVIDAIIDLLPLRNAYSARGRAPPVEVQSSLDRMMLFLRMMRHSSGDLALFNGMITTPKDMLGALFALDDTKGLPPTTAPHGGYLRIEKGGSVLITDAGDAPPAYCALAAHAGALSFEFSSGIQRIIVNCGAPPDGLDQMREALRETQAHSSFSVDAVSSALFRALRQNDRSPVRRLVNPGKAPDWERQSLEEGDFLRCRHTGYAKSSGIIHERELLLSHDGLRLAGTDRLIEDGRRRRRDFPPSSLRFHLHPRIDPVPADGENVIFLQVQDGSLWRFEADGRPLVLEESIFFGGLEMQRKTQQIVVPVLEGNVDVRWSLSQMYGPEQPQDVRRT